MAKKTKEQDVLLVRDEKTGEIGVIAGLGSDGTPKRVAPKAEHAQDFLKFDRHLGQLLSQLHAAVQGTLSLRLLPRGSRAGGQAHRSDERPAQESRRQP